MSATRSGHYVEYLAARAGLGLFARLSPESAGRVADRLADAAYMLDGRRRRVAVGNIMRAGLAGTSADARALARRSFRHFARVIMETIRANAVPQPDGGNTAFAWNEHPAGRALLEDPERGMILASGHLGNWEIGAQALAARKPLAAVARRLNNPYLDRYLRRINPRRRIRQLPKYGEHPLRMLAQAGRGEILALMIDQHARKQAVRVDFFGIPAATHAAVALLPLVTGLPLCFATSIRGEAGRFELTLSEPLDVKRTGNRQADVVAILTDLNHRLENAIREHPDQYLWAHRRWRADC